MALDGAFSLASILFKVFKFKSFVTNEVVLIERVFINRGCFIGALHSIARSVPRLRAGRRGEGAGRAGDVTPDRGSESGHDNARSLALVLG